MIAQEAREHGDGSRRCAHARRLLLIVGSVHGTPGTTEHATALLTATMAAMRRLAALNQHVCPPREHSPGRTAPTPAAASTPVAAAERSRVQLLREYVSSGVVVLPPEALGVPVETHDRMYRIMRERLRKKTLGSNLSYYEAVPALAHMFEAPGLVATLDTILGKDWAYVPFMHSMFVKAGDQDQGWHKDDNAIMNGRKLRHHRPMQVEILYYPSDTDLTFGPTCVLPYSQYWIANNSESDPENFSGTDHLKFFPNKTGGRWGALGDMDPETRDAALEASVTNLGWPLVDGSFENCAVQCKAGTVREGPTRTTFPVAPTVLATPLPLADPHVCPVCRQSL